MQTQATSSLDAKIILELNREYIRSVQASDVEWFQRLLAEDFLCSLPDGSLIDKDRFLKRAAQPPDISNLEVHDVQVRLKGDVAIVHARTTFRMADGQAGAGRYTDVWARQDGRWQAVAAHFTRSS